MRILMVSAEYAPLAKTGGLADAVAGLCDALAARGHDIRVLLPRYPSLATAGFTATDAGTAGEFHYVELRKLRDGASRGMEPRDGGAAHAAGPRVYAVAAPHLAAGRAIYTGDDRDAARFIELCRGALRLADCVGFTPEIVHCHDWHTALLPALLRPAREAPPVLAGTRSVLTLHNVGYQGIFADSVLASNGYAELGALLDADDRAHHRVVFLKLGIRHADTITTVSPTYAKEIQTPEYGMGLDDLLRERRDDLHGILNGVDYGLWSPETDPFLEHHYSRADRSGKARVKRALCESLGLPHPDAPLLGVVTRLVPQKGIDLLVEAFPALLERTAASFALLGSGEADLEQALAALAARHPERISFTRGYDEALAHRIIAGSDLLLVPSRYEPCGLTQMYALRYGTIPVVRATGGLADTIRHFDPATRTGNGSVFEHADAQGLIWGVTTALGWLADPDVRASVMDNGMRADFSWRRQAECYEALYFGVRGGDAPPSDAGDARS